MRESSGRLPCVVSFVAEYPISFSIEINFHDSDGNRYQIPVSGTSDYSIITLQTQVLRGYLSNNDNISQKFRTPLGLALSSKADFTVAETFWDGVYDSVTFWFRDHLAITDKKCSPVSNSKSLETFLNLLTDFGSQNLSKIPTSDTSKGDDQSTKRTSRYFKEVIYFLANHGALVASVKARFLLSCEDFKASLSSLDKKHGTTTHSKSPYETYITHFDLISKEAWCTLFLQLIRTFAVPTGPEANAARHANVPPEKFLINWVSNIAEEMGEEAKTYTSIGEIFTDCVAIAYMLQRYVPFVKGIFKRFNYTPHNDDQLSTNMQEIQASLGHTFGAKFAEEFNISKVYRGKSLDQYLFLLFLHQSLPQFPAKDSMTFHSTLHESAFQSVEIANNSMQSVTYNASICGDSEFTTNEYVFTIPAKSRYSLTVFFKSRFVRPSSGYLIVRSKKLSLYSCSALSFCLKATVDPAIPSQVFTIEARLYSSQNNFALARISNPFSLPGNFQIKLDQKQKLKPHLTVINPPSFSILKKNILIPANSSIDLEVYFCPYDIGAQDCLIAFYDEEVGELLYKIEGKVLSPEPNESLNWLARTGLPFEKNVRIGFQNTIRSQALNAYLTLNLSSKLGSGFSAKSFRERNTILNLEKEKFELPKKSLRYKLEYSNSAFTGPKELVLKYSSESNQHTDLPLTFTPKASGKYFCRIVLSGQDCSDYRTYTVSAIAKPEETKVELEFQTMTKKALVQLLPIVNDTSAEWAIRATINAKGFSCPRSITVQPKTTSELPIEFLPTEAGQSSGSLELRNTTTKQNYSYRLVGIGS